MACIEHTCTRCGHLWFDNYPFTRCPVCDGSAMNDCDEEDSDE